MAFLYCSLGLSEQFPSPCLNIRVKKLSKTVNAPKGHLQAYKTMARHERRFHRYYFRINFHPASQHPQHMMGPLLSETSQKHHSIEPV